MSEVISEHIDLTDSSIAQAGDLAQLISVRHKFFLVRLTPGEVLQTHRGMIPHDELIGLPWGSQITSHLGKTFQMMQPSLADLIQEIQRTTQIVYPKDIGYILVKMGIGPGSQVMEAGTGSGGMTTALAFAVGPQGHVYSYEVRPDVQQLAIKNLSRLGLDERVTFKVRDIIEGFDERGVDAFFLDVQNPFDFIAQVKQALKAGGFFGSIVPTTNQVMRLVAALQENHFTHVDVCEVLLRHYKANPERLRPADRMVAHTGYLVFARSVLV